MSAELEWLQSAVGGQVREFYAAIGVELPDRGGDEAAVRCFANPMAHSHDDRKPSCSVNLLSGLWHCKGCGMSGNAYRAALSVGLSQADARKVAKSFGLFLEQIEGAKKEKQRLPTEPTIRKWRKRLMDSPKILERLFELKGWSVQAIVRCGLGWDGERVVFPVRAPVNTRDGRSLKLVGLVRYVPGGEPKTMMWPGSKRLLFPAPEVIARRRPLFLVEGEPAAVSVWSCGFQATGIPGAGGWKREFADRLRRHRVIMLPDCDVPGRELAWLVGRDLPSVRLVELDAACVDGSDIGDWVVAARDGGGLGQVTRLLERLSEGVESE